MKPQKWPFKPIHITYDGDRISVSDYNLDFGSFSEEWHRSLIRRLQDLKKLTGVGIIPNAQLEGIQTRMCANLGNPTTIVEFAPSGEPVRTDSKLLYYSMHEPCKIFRDYTNEIPCIKCDNCIAKLFYGLNKFNMNEEVSRRIKIDPILSKYIDNGGHVQYITTDRPENRPYVEYDCLLLGYRELVFPIFFEMQVIAVFFVGQLCLSSKLDYISKRQEQFFSKLPDEVIQSFQNSQVEYSIQEIKTKVQKAHELYIDQKKHILSDDVYKVFIDTVKKELRDLEVTLSDQMILERDAYARKNADRLIKEFREKLKESPPSGKDKWNFLWKNAGEIFKKLIERFDLHYVIVFASNKFEQKEAILDVVVNQGDLPANIKESIDNHILGFNLSNVPGACPGCRWNSSGRE